MTATTERKLTPGTAKWILSW